MKKIKRALISVSNKNKLKSLLEILKKNNIVSKSYLKFKILGNGNLTSKVNIEADFSSMSAKEKIEKLGGVLKIKSPR